MTSLVADIIEIGQRLIAVRERIRGEFVEWLDHEFGWSERQAYKIMDVAKSFATVANDLATIELSAIYLLAAPSTPAPVCARVLRMVGTVILRKMIDKSSIVPVDMASLRHAERIGAGH